MPTYTPGSVGAAMRAGQLAHDTRVSVTDNPYAGSDPASFDGRLFRAWSTGWHSRRVVTDYVHPLDPDPTNALKYR